MIDTLTQVFESRTLVTSNHELSTSALGGERSRRAFWDYTDCSFFGDYGALPSYRHLRLLSPESFLIGYHVSEHI